MVGKKVAAGDAVAVKEYYIVAVRSFNRFISDFCGPEPQVFMPDMQL
jgi:hypothetical protein